jgi:hypothetical protein
MLLSILNEPSSAYGKRLPGEQLHSVRLYQKSWCLSVGRV